MSNGEPLVLLVNDDATEGGRVDTVLRHGGYRTVAVSCREVLAHLRTDRPAAVVLDIGAAGDGGLDVLEELRRSDPHLPVILMSSEARTSVVVQAMRLGATDFLCRPFHDRALLTPLAHALQQRRLIAELAPVRRELEAEPKYRLLTGRSARMLEVQRLIERVADTDATVLIRGETGTGKEVAARAIHERSSRAGRPFAKVNCAALPGDLIESELFGYERGAFTGAVHQRPGRFEFANHGTIFLDEIGEMGPGLQAKLLQVLQDGEFSRLGGTSDVRVDVRVIAATNRDLERAVADGGFREDLFFRFNVVSITLPPLRDRREDIPVFLEHFLRAASVHFNRPRPPIPDETARLLFEYDWPGNIRELQNAVSRMVILGTDGPVARDLQRALAARPWSGQVPAATGPVVAAVSAAASDTLVPIRPGSGELGEAATTVTLKDIARAAARAAECVAIAKMLQRTRWNRKAAAEILGISYKALLYKIKENGLDKSPSPS